VSTWLIVWLILTLVSIVAIGAVLAAVVRQALVLMRSVGRFNEEVGPLASEVGREGERASARGSELGPPTATPRG
jgi:hypothetical protein